MMDDNISLILFLEDLKKTFSILEKTMSEIYTKKNIKIGSILNNNNNKYI